MPMASDTVGPLRAAALPLVVLLTVAAHPAHFSRTWGGPLVRPVYRPGPCGGP